MAAATPALRIEGLQKGFASPEGGRVPVVDLPELTLEREAALAVEGESGSGKTTLLHLIAGILPADAGRIEIGGHLMTGLGEAARDRLRARTLGYLFQTFNLLAGLTAYENVLLGMSFRPRAGLAPREAARRALERVGLWDRRHHRPEQLSVGQQQRVAIARALAGQPLLVLADEPTSNLDAARGAQCMDLLEEFCAETRSALLVVTHDPAVATRFARRLVLRAPEPEPAPPGRG